MVRAFATTAVNANAPTSAMAEMVALVDRPAVSPRMRLCLVCTVVVAVARLDDVACDAWHLAVAKAHLVMRLVATDYAHMHICICAALLMCNSCARAYTPARVRAVGALLGPMVAKWPRPLLSHLRVGALARLYERGGTDMRLAVACGSCMCARGRELSRAWDEELQRSNDASTAAVILLRGTRLYADAAYAVAAMLDPHTKRQ